MNAEHGKQFNPLTGSRLAMLKNRTSLSAVEPVMNLKDNTANARLIAAAPELLEACQQLLEAYAPLASYSVATHGSEDCLHSSVKLARAAIAKATGEAK